MVRRLFIVLVLGLLDPFAVAQEPAPAKPKPDATSTAEAVPATPSKRSITAALVAQAYEDAKAACVEVLGAKLEALPVLVMADREELADAVAAENLPIVLQREPDREKAEALARQIGDSIALGAFAKYSWSRKKTLVVVNTWNLQARLLKDRTLAGLEAAQAVLVHELCHALDDARFDFSARLQACGTADASIAFNAVIEGHAQFVTRRVCAKKGWSKGFEIFTRAIGAIPDMKFDEATRIQVQAESTAMLAAYHEGEKFAAAVVAARPDKGEEDLFLAPPRDLDTVLHPEWYLDPSKRPVARFDPKPALDAFVAQFDDAVWTAQRNDVTAQQLSAGMTMIQKEEVDALMQHMRAATITHLQPTANRQSKAVYLVAIEFDSEELARKWVAMSGRISDIKDETMEKGVLRITGSKTTPIDREGIFGLLQEKQMKNGRFAFEVSTVDACHGPVVLESLYSGEPITADAHIALVEELLAKVKPR